MTGPTPVSTHQPTTPATGGVIVVQEAFGVNEHIEDIGRRLAAAGWLAVIPHLFHRTGDPQLDYDDIQAVIPHMAELSAEGIAADLDVAEAILTEAGISPARTGAVGFCMGGTVAFATAATRPLGAAVSFYGGGITTGRFGYEPLVDLAPKLQAPWLGLFGDEDKGIPVEDVELLRAAAATSAKETEVVRYADAGHGFNCDRRSSYHEASATDAWGRTLAWFDRHLGG
ncbi:MAG: carboxymethylenebutenolidase [Acidimicrobiales bacterium]|nr:carboxymethylenebutenolidase [Acidimicrobiales bacterium]